MKRKNPWLENSIKNLLSLSKSPEFKQALSEWFFTGEVMDHLEAEEICQLCEHERLRYHYQIENKILRNYLWVGSSCILRFAEIEVYEEGGRLLQSEKGRKRELTRALKEKQKELALEPLRNLWTVDQDNRQSIEFAVAFFKLNKGFKPSHIANLREWMDHNGINYNPKLLPVHIRTLDSHLDFKMLTPARKKLVFECMTPMQQESHPLDP